LKTVEELQDDLERHGRPRYWVQRAEDRDSPRLEGVIVVTRIDDGTWKAATWGRGEEVHPRVFSSEAEAVSHLAEELLRPMPTGEATSEAERQAANARMQAKARETLRRWDGRDSGSGSGTREQARQGRAAVTRD
jgi:hypothetical protein